MPCPQQPFARLVLLPECLCRSLLVRLPAVKVTLPAAIDYTGAHSQAEYNIALEGRFWGLDLRRWALWNFWTTPELVSMITLLPLVKSWKVVSRNSGEKQTLKKDIWNIYEFMSLHQSACLVQQESNCLLQLSVHGCCILTRVREKKPAGIRTALMGQQQSLMSHNSPSRHKRKSNPIVFNRGYQRAFKTAFVTLFSSLNSKGGDSTFIRQKKG